MKTLVVHTIKGGVGKTFFSSQLAAYCAHELKLRVLCIDVDEQQNFHNWAQRYRDKDKSDLKPGDTAINVDFLETSVFDVFLKSKHDSIPGMEACLTFVNNKNNQYFDPEIKEKRNRDIPLEITELKRYWYKNGTDSDHIKRIANNFKNFLEVNDDNYDICIIDNPPTSSSHTLQAALITSDNLIIVTENGQHSIDGIRNQLSTLSRYISFCANLNIRPKFTTLGKAATDWIIGFIPNKFRDIEANREENENLFSELSGALVRQDYYTFKKGTDKEILLDNNNKPILMKVEVISRISAQKRYNEMQFAEAIFGRKDYAEQQQELRPIFFDLIAKMGVSNASNKNKLTEDDFKSLKLIREMFGDDWKFVLCALWGHNERIPGMQLVDTNKLRDLKTKLTQKDLFELEF